MTSFLPPTFTSVELIGDTKVAITDQPVNALHLAMDIAAAKFRKKNDEAFLITNLDAVFDRFTLWKRELPMIEPFYAFKCNTDEAILHSLAALGVGFDCSSKSEIDTILRMGVSPDRIVYANPTKSSTFIEYANDNGVRMITFDSADELEMIAVHHTNPQLVLRIAVSDPTASCPQIGKYGADPMTVAPNLLTRAVELGIGVAGVSFHVGSGCRDPTAYRAALAHARNLVDAGRKLGHSMEIVDVGGGFPGGEHQPSFEEMASIIRSAIGDYFPDNDVRLIAEPGRFFVDHPCTLVVNVIARKAVVAKHGETSSTHMHYFVNEGVFGCFNCIVNDRIPKYGRPLFNGKGESFLSTIWGPSCDSLDRIEENKAIRALDVGDWLIYEDMGAYTTSIATTFNGFPWPTPVHVVSDRIWKILGLAGNNNEN